MLFISHRTTDKAAAEDLRRRALARGYSAEQLFLDSDPESGIAAGEDWEHVISDRLKKCQALIVVCSPRWAESKWCFAELVYAKTQGKLVFPVVIEECVLDAVLGERQAVFVFREGENAVERLWKSLEEHGLGPHEHRPWPPDHGDPCPFPGLDYFSDRFAPVYFGRQPEVADVLDQLKKMRGGSGKRLLLIHGGSGSGKSSLLRAGVLPRLDHHTGRTDWLVLPTLRYGETGDSLPLLAFTLEKHFRQCAADKLIELTEYESLGGMTGAISQAVKNILPAKFP